MTSEVQLGVIHQVGEVRPEDWNGLLSTEAPFLRHEWLKSLEETGCVSEAAGWIPHHLLLKRADRLVAACPMYLKLHSMGEFVFDHEWARAAGRIGVAYYPKLLVGVPFTPVTGPRLLIRHGESRSALSEQIGQALIRIAEQNGISSVHINFCLEEEKEALCRLGFLPRVGLQFQWKDAGYASFEGYLARFRSQRRTKIRRERRALDEQGISIRVVEGDAITPALLQTMFGLYKAHIDRLFYGEQYLNREFFQELSRCFTRHICLIVAERDSRMIAGTFNVRGDSALYGRYWGAFEHHPFLHFNVCYYSAIEHCIRSGLNRFEAGAGGSFKRLRGLDPERTFSVHYLTNVRLRKAIQAHLEAERLLVEERRSELLAESQLKQDGQSA